MADSVADVVRNLAGVILDLVPVPDGENRELLLDIANPQRAAIKEIVRKSDAADERADLRRATRALDRQALTDEQVHAMVCSVLDPTDVQVMTVSHDHTIGALEALRDDLDPDKTTEAEHEDVKDPIQRDGNVPYDPYQDPYDRDGDRDETSPYGEPTKPRREPWDDDDFLAAYPPEAHPAHPNHGDYVTRTARDQEVQP